MYVCSFVLLEKVSEYFKLTFTKLFYIPLTIGKFSQTTGFCYFHFNLVSNLFINFFCILILKIYFCLNYISTFCIDQITLQLSIFDAIVLLNLMYYFISKLRFSLSTGKTLLYFCQLVIWHHCNAIIMSQWFHADVFCVNSFHCITLKWRKRDIR